MTQKSQRTTRFQNNGHPMHVPTADSKTKTVLSDAPIRLAASGSAIKE